jgi:hypothetical protein
MLTRRNFWHGSKFDELHRTAKTSGDNPARFFLRMGRDSTAIHAAPEGVTGCARPQQYLLLSSL